MAVVILAELIRDGRLLWILLPRLRTRARRRSGDVAAAWDCPVPEIGKRMKCSACGSRKVHTAPELYLGGIQAMRTRWGGKQPSATP